MIREKLTVPPNREHVVSECCNLVEDEVKAKGGLTGLAVKGAYGVVKAVKPRFVSEVIDGLLDQWVAKLEPFYAAWQVAGIGTFADYLKKRGPEVADALLQVTDARAQHAKSGSVKKMYDKMRSSAKKHVEDALPRLGNLVETEVKNAKPTAPGPASA